MNQSLFTSFGNIPPQSLKYATELKSKPILDKFYYIGADDAGLILTPNIAITPSIYITSEAEIEPFSIFYISVTGTTTQYVDIKPQPNISLWRIGAQKQYKFGTTYASVRLYGSYGFATIFKGLANNWYITGAGLLE